MLSLRARKVDLHILGRWALIYRVKASPHTRATFDLQSSPHDDTRQATDRKEGEAPRIVCISPIHAPKMEQTNETQGFPGAQVLTGMCGRVKINVQVGLTADLQYIEYRHFSLSLSQDNLASAIAEDNSFSSFRSSAACWSKIRRSCVNKLEVNHRMVNE